jgi:hypothetical protein
MPWKEKSPTPDQIKRRLAYLIACRCRQQGAGKIAKIVGVNRDTISSYADPDYATKGGPQNIETIIKIFQATGDDFAQAVYAAQNSSDANSFWAMLHCVLVGQQNLQIRATNEDRLAGGSMIHQPLPSPRTRATDPKISLDPVYDDAHQHRRYAG